MRFNYASLCSFYRASLRWAHPVAFVTDCYYLLQCTLDKILHKHDKHWDGKGKELGSGQDKYAGAIMKNGGATFRRSSADAIVVPVSYSCHPLSALHICARVQKEWRREMVLA